jgi:mono/diheme cytochrome c family protein
MKVIMKTPASIVCLLIPACLVLAQEKPETDRKDSIGRGKYIVDQVAMCIECHTPRDQNGRLLGTKYLEGAPVPVKEPPFQKFKWAIKAPALAGLPGYTKEQGVRLLTEGITADGRSPDPPMPRFRLNRSDAEAVVAYLKSLR